MPHVAVEPPPNWVAADVPRPPLAESTGAIMTEWRSVRSIDRRMALVSGCVSTPIPGWVEDMRPAIEARTTALAGAATEKVTGVPMDARADDRGLLVLRAASHLDGQALGLSRTFVGFDGDRVVTCFATCAAFPTEPTDRPTNAALPSPRMVDCEAAVVTARLEGTSSPPKPGLALRSLTWAVHHPRPAAWGGGFFVVAAGIFAVVTRRRPRSARP